MGDCAACRRGDLYPAKPWYLVTARFRASPAAVRDLPSCLGQGGFPVLAVAPHLHAAAGLSAGDLHRRGRAFCLLGAERAARPAVASGRAGRTTDAGLL